MPEGPEIRLAADQVARVVAGQKIDAVEFGIPRLKRFESRLAGQRVADVETRGKAMLTRFDNGLTIYSHNQLYGRWYTARRPNRPDTGRQLRLALHTSTHSALLYSASDIDVLTDKQLARHPFLSRLGPDILDRSLTPQLVAERLESPEFSGRSLGALYLDQRFLAGLGNYLRSEILWAARVDPAVRPKEMTLSRRRSLARKTLSFSRRSYRTRGVIVSPSLAKSLRDQGQRYSQYRFYVFAREGLPCRECGTTIERRTMGSRGLFVCPTCQAI